MATKRFTKEERSFYEKLYRDYQATKHRTIESLERDPMFPTIREKRAYAASRAFEGLIDELAEHLYPDFTEEAWYSCAWEKWVPAPIRKLLERHRWGSGGLGADDAIKRGRDRAEEKIKCRPPTT